MNTNNLNRNLLSKTLDKFYVKFMGIDNNDSNILGRQVYSIERPIINFDITELREKMIPYYSQTIIRFDPITIEFRDDIDGATSKILYDSLIKQNDHALDEFDIRIETLDSKYVPVDAYVLRRCYIQNVVGTPLSHMDISDAMITLTIGFETLDFDNTFEFIDTTEQGAN